MEMLVSQPDVKDLWLLGEQSLIFLRFQGQNLRPRGGLLWCYTKEEGRQQEEKSADFGKGYKGSPGK